MGKTLEQFVQQLDAVLQDKAKLLGDGEKERAIAQAIEDYSRERPRKRKFDFAGDSATFDVPTPADWVMATSEGAFQSQVASIEYPAGERAPVYLDAEDFLTYRKVDGTEVIRFVASTPQTGKTARIEYTVPHTQPDVTASSAPDSDFYAIADLAGSFAFLRLAARQAQSIDVTVGADSIDRQSQADAYRGLARDCFKSYERRMGKDAETSPAAAGATRDLDTQDQRGVDRLTHPGRLR